MSLARRAVSCLVLIGLALHGSLLHATASEPGFGGALQDSFGKFWGNESDSEVTSGGVADTVGASKPRRESILLPACAENTPNLGVDVQCQASGAACPQGMTRLILWTAAPGTVFGQSGWTIAGTTCGDPAVAGVAPPVLPAMSVEDFRRLPLPPGTPSVQPGSGRVLIRVATNVFVDAQQTVLDTTLLGFAVQVRATPERFVWDFGDGAVVQTEDAGAPYPDLRVTHAYEASGSYAIGLTTVYSGEYSVAGGPWLPVPGEAQVVSASVPVVAVAGRNELVGDALP